MLIKNALVCGSDFTFAKGSLAVSGDRIVSAQDYDDSEVLDAAGLMAFPGLIDIHLHGAAGYDFGDATADALSAITAWEAASGVTTVCPTVMTMPLPKMYEALRCAAEFVPDARCAACAGIYLEGPFLSPQKAGAHDRRQLHRPDPGLFAEFWRAAGGRLKFMTLAPELDGAAALAGMVPDTLTVCLGHTAADYRTARKALDSWACQLTHLFNAMPPMLHRAPGPIAAGADDPHCLAELICDCRHVDPAAVRMAFRLFGAERIIMISDSMRACGMPDGHYTLGGLDVISTAGTVTLPDGTLAGAATSLYENLVRTVRTAGIPLGQALRSATAVPAAALGMIGSIGTLQPGSQADILLADQDLNLKHVILRGRLL